MLDQMFTAENFRRIYDAENRKGADLGTRYFPTLEPFTLSIRNKVQEIRDLRKSETTFKASDFEVRLLTLKAELTDLKVVKSSAVDALMDEISQKVLKPSFKIDLSQNPPYSPSIKIQLFLLTEARSRVFNQQKPLGLCGYL